MSKRLFIIFLAVGATLPFTYFFRQPLFRLMRAHAATTAVTVPDRVPLTLTFSEIVSVNSKPEQHAVRVIAYKRDHSVSDTYFWTHMPDPGFSFDRQMWLYKPDGYFRVEVYGQTRSRVTFPSVPQMNVLKKATGMDPRHDCLQTYAGKSSLASLDRYVGKQKLFIPGSGIVDTVMTIYSTSDMTLTSWYSPSLGCAEVQHVATFPQSNGEVNVNAMYPVAVALGDPSEDLFGDGAAQEVDPLEAMRRKIRYHGAREKLSQTDVMNQETKLVNAAGSKNKEKHYLEAWNQYHQGKLR